MPKEWHSVDSSDYLPAGHDETGGFLESCQGTILFLERHIQIGSLEDRRATEATMSEQLLIKHLDRCGDELGDVIRMH